MGIPVRSVFSWCRCLCADEGQRYGLSGAQGRGPCGGKPVSLDRQEFCRSHRLLVALAISIFLS